MELEINGGLTISREVIRPGILAYAPYPPSLDKELGRVPVIVLRRFFDGSFLAEEMGKKAGKVGRYLETELTTIADGGGL